MAAMVEKSTLQLMHETFTTYKKMRYCLEFLVSSGLIEYDKARGKYKTTQRGKRCLEKVHLYSADR
jgi:predicted transcriptional regulator